MESYTCHFCNKIINEYTLFHHTLDMRTFSCHHPQCDVEFLTINRDGKEELYRVSFKNINDSNLNGYALSLYVDKSVAIHKENSRPIFLDNATNLNPSNIATKIKTVLVFS